MNQSVNEPVCMKAATHTCMAPKAWLTSYKHIYLYYASCRDRGVNF